MFKIIQQNRKQTIVNSDGEVIYSPPHFIVFKGYDLTKLLNLINKKGYRDIDDVIAFEAGKLK